MKRVWWYLVGRNRAQVALIKRQADLINGMSATCASQRDLLASAAVALARAAVSLSSGEPDAIDQVAPAHGKWVN